ncbi:hypothetical protein [Jeotgalicoccus marinus]|nr:hypothetical protein [Jeotgalicoccus marinus]
MNKTSVGFMINIPGSWGVYGDMVLASGKWIVMLILHQHPRQVEMIRRTLITFQTT